MDTPKTVDGVAALLAPTFKRHHVRRAVLFGSVAKGTAKDTSDLDILVDSGLSGLRFVGLLEDIRAAAGTDVDLLDVTHIRKGSVIEQEIERTGVVIYEE